MHSCVVLKAGKANLTNSIRNFLKFIKRQSPEPTGFLKYQCPSAERNAMIHANKADPAKIEAVACIVSDFFASFYCCVTYA